MGTVEAETAAAWAAGELGEHEESACAVFVEKGNEAAIGLYKRCGFVEMSEEAYTGTDGRKGVGIGLRKDIPMVKKT